MLGGCAISPCAGISHSSKRQTKRRNVHVRVQRDHSCNTHNPARPNSILLGSSWQHVPTCNLAGAWKGNPSQPLALTRIKVGSSTLLLKQNKIKNTVVPEVKKISDRDTGTMETNEPGKIGSINLRGECRHMYIHV